jgi:hypothetical protein
LELQLVIQDVVAQPCALLLQNNSILQVRCLGIGQQGHVNLRRTSQVSVIVRFAATGLETTSSHPHAVASADNFAPLTVRCVVLIHRCGLSQALKDFRPDVVTAIGTPVPDTATDSCGCLLSHALGVPMIDIDCGMTFWSGPPSVPQVGALIIKQTIRPSVAASLPLGWVGLEVQHEGCCTASMLCTQVVHTYQLHVYWAPSNMAVVVMPLVNL